MYIIFSIRNELNENSSPRISAFNDSQNLDSVSKENLWLKLGKEIYHRQVSNFINSFRHTFL